MFVFAASACSVSSPDDTVAFARVFDACAPLAISAPSATDSQHASLIAATALWAAVGIDGLHETAPAAVTIMFERAAPSAFGYYDDTDSTIHIDDALADPASSIVIAHELGHAFGLMHVPAATRLSVMNPGNLDVAPTGEDRRTVATLWTDCAAR
ncbi:MAG: DUF6782 family putative metallopeptidase [Kofleriaceae bacterium]